MTLIDVRHGDTSIFVRADQIAAVLISGQRATVTMTDGRVYHCTNPGAVRDAWVQAQQASAPLEDTSFFGRLFGPSHK